MKLIKSIFNNCLLVNVNICFFILSVASKQIIENVFLQKFSRAPTVSRSVYVPSIPSCERSYGYDINEDGSIIKHFPPASDSTLGPAYYKPQFVSIMHFLLIIGRLFIIMHVLVNIILTALINTPSNLSGLI